MAIIFQRRPSQLSIFADVTAYYQDTVDLTSLATLPAAPINTVNLAKNNFFPIEVVGDIARKSDDTAIKGLFLSKDLVTKSSPAGAASGDVVNHNMDDISTYYGSNVSYEAILHCDVPVKPSSIHFV